MRKFRSQRFMVLWNPGPMGFVEFFSEAKLPKLINRTDCQIFDLDRRIDAKGNPAEVKVVVESISIQKVPCRRSD